MREHWSNLRAGYLEELAEAALSADMLQTTKLAAKIALMSEMLSEQMANDLELKYQGALEGDEE
jgi:hypothetical protein